MAVPEIAPRHRTALFVGASSSVALRHVRAAAARLPVSLVACGEFEPPGLAIRRSGATVAIVDAIAVPFTSDLAREAAEAGCEVILLACTEKGGDLCLLRSYWMRGGSAPVARDGSDGLAQLVTLTIASAAGGSPPY